MAGKLESETVKGMSLKGKLHNPAGVTTWGPLPDTEAMYLMWDGALSGIYLVMGEPTQASSSSTRVRHPSASGAYHSLEQARAAVKRFIEADSN